MTRNAKILFIVGAVIIVIGGIVAIAAIVTAGASVKVGFEIEGVTSGSMDVGENSGGLGFSVHIKASEVSNCDTHHSTTTVTDSNGADVSLTNECSSSSFSTEDWQTNNDPPLMKMGHFALNSDPGLATQKVRGTYELSSSTQLWVVDDLEEFGEAVGGIMAAGLGLIIGMILASVGSILCCVGCCCMCTS